MSISSLEFSDYLVFVDESGDHGLQSIDPQFPIFVLVFIIISKIDYIERLVPAIKKLKLDFWGHDCAILHAHEIRKPKNDFAFLQNAQRREIFITALNKVIENAPIHIVASVIHKERHIKQYVTPFNPYHLALGFGLERLHGFLQCRKQEKKVTHIIAEGRGIKEDTELELEFRRVMSRKSNLSYSVGNSGFDIKIVPKKINSEGLQLADLIAHPIARYCLNPIQHNRAFEIIRSKLTIEKSDGTKEFALKRFP